VALRGTGQGVVRVIQRVDGGRAAANVSYQENRHAVVVWSLVHVSTTALLVPGIMFYILNDPEVVPLLGTLEVLGSIF